MPLHVEASDPSVLPWVPQPSILRLLDERTARDVRVVLWPRAELDAAWALGHRGEPPPPGWPPYLFRAWAQPTDGLVNILVDDTETPESVTWLLLHELSHHELRASPLVTGALAATQRSEAYLHSDDAHQNDPEERIADWIATRWYRRLGFDRPWRLDRRWWRARTPRGGAGA